MSWLELQIINKGNVPCTDANIFTTIKATDMTISK